MIGEMTLDGTDKVQTALDRIREFEPPDGYYVAYSGGKDSGAILWLVKHAGVKYDAHYSVTTCDPPELVHFIRQTHPEVEFHHPSETMWSLIPKNRMPPTRIARYCCKYLKEGEGSGRTIITGVRWAESVRRKKRKMVELCNQDPTKQYLHPIIDWSNDEVWELHHLHDIPYCSLYNEGFKRLGCVMCPMQGQAGMKWDAERWPKIAAAYKRAMQKCVEKRIADGLKTEWTTGQEMYDWWIGDDSPLDDGGLFV